MQSKVLKHEFSWPFILGIFITSLLVILTGVLFYNYQKKKLVTERQNELAAIANLKIRDIEKWRMEHLRDARILSTIVPRNKYIFEFLADDNEPELRMEVLQRMKTFIENYDYHSILLTDTSGNVRLTYPHNEKSTLPLRISLLPDYDTSNIIFSDLHLSDDMPDVIHLDLHIPLFMVEDNRKEIFGTILLRIDPWKTLFPMIQSWPTPSKSSETLLIRRDGDSVLYLNELRHQKNTALKLKLPMDSLLPASLAVSGHEGVFEGFDYRGIEVISYLKHIPDSPWFMVAKVDADELYYPLKRIIIFISLIAFLVILSLSVIIIQFWRNQHIGYLRQLNATKDKFFSIVSHDLRSPFSSILGFAELLVDDLRKKEFVNAENYAKIIQDSSMNAVDLLSNLSEWSRLHTDRLVFKPKEIDIVSVIDEVTELMNASAIQKSIRIIKKSPDQMKVYADKDMIGSVLRNLISNSIKFSEPGGKIHISVIQKLNEIIVAVSDYGIGIEKELISKLFRIEESVSTLGTQNEEGTGLGLILVKEFITLHGGRVYVESEVGRCSKFIFTLPVK